MVACREDRAQAVDACGAKASVKQTQGDKIMRDISRREPMETMLLAGAGFLHAERQVGGGQSPLHERAESGRSTENISAVIIGPSFCNHTFVADSFEKRDDFCIAPKLADEFFYLIRPDRGRVFVDEV